MVPVYRDWDTTINEGHVPKMVYTTYLHPGVEKDIILHKKRKTYITCIYGNVKVTTYEEGKMQTSILNFSKAENLLDLLIIEPNIPIKIDNLSDHMSILLNCPTPSWHPDDEDTYKFKSWEEYDKCLDSKIIKQEWYQEA